jgi:hypothetical protein
MKQATCIVQAMSKAQAQRAAYRKLALQLAGQRVKKIATNATTNGSYRVTFYLVKRYDR